MKALALLLGFAAASLAQTGHQHHPPRSAEEYIRVLNDPKRDAWQKPDEVVKALNLKRDETVADIGAGSGYFTRRFAARAGKVYAVDIDPKLLEAVRDGAPPNLVTVLAAPDDPGLPPASVDTLFFCNVLHHIRNRAAYYGKLDLALKPGGRIVILEFYKKPLPVGPPESMKLTAEEVVSELRGAGFRKTRSFDFLPYQYFLVFER
ncbi:MAG: class I SAM-dependent methyltransferase [Bryobacterales bacterium]|nr:class I SAM-dependent methyltransferase [Bryobacterales bacterium]